MKIESLLMQCNEWRGCYEENRVTSVIALFKISILWLWDWLIAFFQEIKLQETRSTLQDCNGNHTVSVSSEEKAKKCCRTWKDLWLRFHFPMDVRCRTVDWCDRPQWNCGILKTVSLITRAIKCRDFRLRLSLVIEWNSMLSHIRANRFNQWRKAKISSRQFLTRFSSYSSARVFFFQTTNYNKFFRTTISASNIFFTHSKSVLKLNFKILWFKRNELINIVLWCHFPSFYQHR